MKINLEDNPIDDLEIRVRAIMGVPELILLDEVIASPDFLVSSRYNILLQFVLKIRLIRHIL